MPEYRWSYYLTAPWELVDEWYRAIKFGIRNLIQWFPVIWQDRHYTSSGLFSVMHRKLSLMRNELQRNPYYVGAKRDQHLMRVCEVLIERYLAEAYGAPCHERHRQKWGESRSFFEPGYDNETGEFTPDFCRWITDWPNTHTPEQREQATEEMLACLKHEQMLAEQDIAYLFKLLGRHYRRW
ncbi:hypothetical protein [Salidesulfovibrio brasiliensis]|uniref:hypothetical protein n=1 Tax=Salidesulfovibrio brasiliensis TaxID=221711 RepID=UPI0006D21DC3|nr:hypothetical protein [Salidesulfovibrio brasiliensis]